MTNNQEDLDLLLSLQDRVLETPPASPSALHSKSAGYLSDNGSPKRTGQSDMSVFCNAVQDCLDYEPENTKKSFKSDQTKKSNDAEFEKFSGLLIRNQLISQLELSNHLSDIRFVRLPAISNVLKGDTLSGCWATVGVLTERGNTKLSSTGKNFCIWKIGSLDEMSLSVFLFGDAYEKYSKEASGTVFALFNCGVRNDNLGPGFSLSVYSPGQILKIGTSSDYGVCKGKRKDGAACTLVINKRHGVYCSYHRSRESEKYSVKRTELKGGKFRMAFPDALKSKGIYLVDPLADRTNSRKVVQPAKLLSVEALKKALSKAGKVTTNAHSQGIRFLTEVTENSVLKPFKRAQPLSKMKSSEKRLSSSARLDTPAVRSQQTSAKRSKMEMGTSSAKTKDVREKMIELDFITSSDEEM